MAYPKNYVIFVDGMGFLTETNRPDDFFVDVIEEAQVFHEKEAEKMALILCENYEMVSVLKKCSRHQSSKFYI